MNAARVRDGLQPVCGRCRAPLRTSSGVVEVADTRFEEQVLSSPLPVLLDVWAPWCVPCRGMEPVIEDLASTLAGRVRVAKLNIDRCPEAAARLRIVGVPTLIVFRNGREVVRMIGERGKDDVMRALAGVA
ncbi:MAG TPA: thioredoxin family protein [Vicinamibacteria bacterium]|nr:thioredoxin family protein [Vicinamibacteria bacterium]